jgi:hypothetical protein
MLPPDRPSSDVKTEQAPDVRAIEANAHAFTGDRKGRTINQNGTDSRASLPRAAALDQ